MNYLLSVYQHIMRYYYIIINQKYLWGARWPAVSSLQRSRKSSNVDRLSDGKFFISSSDLHSSEGTLRRWSGLHLPIRTGPAWWVMARSPYLWSILCPSRGDINRPMMIMMMIYFYWKQNNNVYFSIWNARNEKNSTKFNLLYDRPRTNSTRLA
jgi:hypothetical protein